MTQRYFVDEPIAGDRATLAGAEAHHLLHVMRARRGDEVTLFDGSGDEFPARVESFGRSTVELAVLARQTIDRELPLAIRLGVALPKGDRQRWLVEKAVELGVTELVPLVTERGVAQGGEQAVERLRRAVIEASKQCGRNRLMQLSAPQAWTEYLATAPAGSLRLMAHPSAEASPNLTARMTAAHLAVGPEGGFSPGEVAAALDAGWQGVDLGPRIMRVETAAVLLIARVIGCRP